MRVAADVTPHRTVNSGALHTFTPVMAAGVLSLAADLQRLEVLSAALLVIAVAALVAILILDLCKADVEASQLALVLFTWVAACAVLSERLGAARAFLGPLALLGFLAAVIALGRLLRGRRRGFRSWPVRGSWLLAIVALQSLSILSSSAGMDAAAIGLWLVGIAAYAGLAALIVRRLVQREASAITPDCWITMGALAISTVAAVRLSPGLPSPLVIAVWAGGVAWIPYLCVAEAARIRARGFEFRYDAWRWSTVFPLGMLSVASYEVAARAGISALRVIGSASFWIALALAAATAAAGAARRRGGGA